MSKTIREWFQELEEPYRTQAIENTNNYGKSTDADLLEELDVSAADALIGSFVWSDSPEGFKYWNNLHEELK